MINYVILFLAFSFVGWCAALAWSAVVHYDEYKRRLYGK